MGQGSLSVGSTMVGAAKMKKLYYLNPLIFTKCAKKVYFRASGCVKIEGLGLGLGLTIYRVQKSDYLEVRENLRVRESSFFKGCAKIKGTKVQSSQSARFSTYKTKLQNKQNNFKAPQVESHDVC